jgi:hypothetical protein
MKVGDLVTMEEGLKGKIVFSGLGVVVDMRRRKYDEHRRRVGIFWCDGGGTIDWEPMGWLEVVSARED